jgi:hypothetical protein
MCKSGRPRAATPCIRSMVSEPFLILILILIAFSRETGRPGRGDSLPAFGREGVVAEVHSSMSAPNSLCVEYMECGGKRSATPL